MSLTSAYITELKRRVSLQLCREKFSCSVTTSLCSADKRSVTEGRVPQWIFEGGRGHHRPIVPTVTIAEHQRCLRFKAPSDDVLTRPALRHRPNGVLLISTHKLYHNNNPTSSFILTLTLIVGAGEVALNEV